MNNPKIARSCDKIFDFFDQMKDLFEFQKDSKISKPKKKILRQTKQ